MSVCEFDLEEKKRAEIIEREMIFFILFCFLSPYPRKKTSDDG